MTFCLLLLAIPMPLKAVSMDTSTGVPDSVSIVNTAAATALIGRLDEIALIDKAKLLPSERKALRKEVRSIKKQVRELGGVYISVGSLLIVILLLILLL